VRIGMEEQLSLHVAGQNVWVANEDDWTRYDWNSGNASQKISAPESVSVAPGNELLAFERTAGGAPEVVRVDLATGTVTTNDFPDLAINPQNPARPNISPPGGLPLSPNSPAQPMDANRVVQQAQNLTPQGRIALPAVVANNAYEQRLEKEMADNGNSPQKHSTVPPLRTQNFMLVPDGDGFQEFLSQLTRANFVQRDAMKAAPAKSALDNVNGLNQTAAVNEQLNEIQRTTGGDKVTEDQSTYHVTIRKAGAPDQSWSGEVTGPPQLVALKTVNVLTAGKTVVVLDKSNKKLWQADLTYGISGGGNNFSPEKSLYGDGPCVERDGTLYIFDAAVLSAFDVTTGNARWRIPSVGVVGLFFDDKGNLYVNTTTGNPDDIKYSRQIDVSKATEAVFMKIEPASGKILWSVKPGGFVTYFSGKFIYAIQSFDPGDEDEQMSDALAGLEKPPLTRIIRLSPADGRILWQRDEPRAPMNIQCDGSSIRIIFKKEVEVLHYFTF
ncbi:MAG TPA: PQQ-binding-like beta-propeller repeat protein, partial [Pyrinomonadaceae bacterium]|nr:PQQ-binding-like beta-propeller repeat protein [Pyrinomonadaceae bacterium]